MGQGEWVTVNARKDFSSIMRGPFNWSLFFFLLVLVLPIALVLLNAFYLHYRVPRFGR